MVRIELPPGVIHVRFGQPDNDKGDNKGNKPEPGQQPPTQPAKLPPENPKRDNGGAATKPLPEKEPEKELVGV